MRKSQEVRNALKEYRRNRDICFVCKTDPGDGNRIVLYHLGWIAVCYNHKNGCNEFVRSLERIPGKTKAGRWRPINELLQLLTEKRMSM